MDALSALIIKFSPHLPPASEIENIVGKVSGIDEILAEEAVWRKSAPIEDWSAEDDKLIKRIVDAV